MTVLAEYLRASAARPFAWGTLDCVLFACDWVREQRGVDPAEPHRGGYDTPLGAHRIMAQHNGLEGLARLRMAAAGLSETDRPQPGDVGLVEMVNGDALAICTPLGWAVKGDKGIVVAPMPHRVAWSV